MTASPHSDTSPSAGPFFSVCVPVFNGEPYLRQCLDSILAQTFEDFEVLVVDDCSSDASVELVRSYQRRDARIRLVQNPSNLGLVANWNRCLSLAQGQWIRFLFQDDYWSPTCLQEVHAHCAGHDFVFHRRRFVFDGEVRPQLLQFYGSEAVTRYPGLMGVTELSQALVSQLMLESPGFNFFGEPSSVAFKRELISELGTFDERLVQLCDYEYWARLTSNSGGYHLDRELSTFRVHGKATSSANLDSREFRFKFIDKLLVLRQFSKDPRYTNLRVLGCQRDALVLERLYRKHERNIAGELRDAPKASRIAMIEQLELWAPFAADEIVRLAAHRFGFLRGELRRFVKNRLGA